mgnify:FL=1
MEQSYLNMFLQGGIIIYILFIISIISLAIIIERLVVIYKRNAAFDDFFSKLKSIIKSGDAGNLTKALAVEELLIGKIISKLKPDSASNPLPNKEIIEDAITE